MTAATSMPALFRFTAISVCVCLCACLLEAGAVSADERPNILLIVSEDNGPELGCYGHPYVKTPVLDAFAAEGVRFENAYVPQAGCSQSRAALLTGLYPHQNGQIGLATWKFRMYREDTPNMVRSLKQAGYRTGLIGKLHVNPKSAFPFDTHKISTSNFSRQHQHRYAEYAEQFMSTGDAPFFLSVNYPDAHRPFVDRVDGRPEQTLSAEDVRPPDYIGLDTPELRQQTASYYNCMSRLDSLVGELLNALERSGQANNTLVVYLGDHGADLLRGKRTSCEGGLRIPLLVRWPRKIVAPQVRSELVSTLDLMPTFLAVAAADPVERLSGRSLLPLLNDEAVSWREFLFSEFHLHSAHNFYPQRTVRDTRFKLIQNLLTHQINPGYDFTMERFFQGLPEVIEAAPEPVRSAYRRMRRPPEFELYDLRADPHEFVNLADQPAYRDIQNKLQRQLTNWREQSGDPLLDEASLARLSAEIDACFVDGKPSKERLQLSYPQYFFSSNSTGDERPE